MKEIDYNVIEDLHRAIETDEDKTVSKIFRRHPNLCNFPYDEENVTSPLIYAAWQGAVKVARWLIEAGADITQRDKKKWTLLHYAACHSHPEVMELLLIKGVDPNLRDDELNYTPLHYAIRTSGLEGCTMVGLLLKHGAILDLQAAVSLGLTNVVRAFLHEDPNCVHSTSNAKDLLWEAVLSKSLPIVELLIRAGADPNAVEHFPATCLAIIADRKECIEITRFLLEHGADPDYKPKPGSVSARFQAVSQGPELRALFRKYPRKK